MVFEIVDYKDLIKYSYFESLETAIMSDLNRIPADLQLFTIDIGQSWLPFIESNYKRLNLKVLQQDEIDKNQVLKDRQTAFILPEVNFTVFNINFDRIAQKEISSPYMVFIRNLKSRHSTKFLLENGFNFSGEFFSFFPHLARHYMQSETFLQWLTQKSCPEPHSARIENNFFDKDQSRKIDPLALKSFYSKTKADIHIEFDHYPIHLFYKKYLNIELNINLTERLLYEA